MARSLMKSACTRPTCARPNISASVAMASITSPAHMCQGLGWSARRSRAHSSVRSLCCSALHRGSRLSLKASCISSRRLEAAGTTLERGSERGEAAEDDWDTHTSERITPGPVTCQTAIGHRPAVHLWCLCDQLWGQCLASSLRPHRCCDTLCITSCRRVQYLAGRAPKHVLGNTRQPRGAQQGSGRLVLASHQFITGAMQSARPALRNPSRDC